MDSLAVPAWHPGELAMQASAGVDPERSRLAAAAMRPFLSPQHRDFFPQLPFLVVGAVDGDGRPWATLLDGAPGFAHALDATHLRVDALPDPADPAAAGLDTGDAVGLLGIQLATRRRNRVNGRVDEVDGRGWRVAVDAAFGNCPRYIHARDLAPAAPGDGIVERRSALDDAARAAIARATTFFVASYVDVDATTRQVDVSHRGGPAGFVRAAGDILAIPDFAGNRYFNTLGNLLANPRAGLAFPDFATGDVLQVTGDVEIVRDGPDIARFEGAERLWLVQVRDVVRRRGVLRWRAA